MNLFQFIDLKNRIQQKLYDYWGVIKPFDFRQLYRKLKSKFLLKTLIYIDNLPVHLIYPISFL